MHAPRSCSFVHLPGSAPPLYRHVDSVPAMRTTHISIRNQKQNINHLIVYVFSWFCFTPPLRVCRFRACFAHIMHLNLKIEAQDESAAFSAGKAITRYTFFYVAMFFLELASGDNKSLTKMRPQNWTPLFR